jgi:hypothetical protein
MGRRCYHYFVLSIKEKGVTMSECNELHRQLKQEIVSDFTVVKDGVKEILKILNGNGNIGLCAKVNFLWGSFIFLISTAIAQAFIIVRFFLS